MNEHPISFLIDYFGEKWLLKNLQKMHASPGKKGRLPPAQSTLTMIRSHPVVQCIWAIEKNVINIVKRNTQSISHTEDSTKLLYLSHDLYTLKNVLPKGYINELKERYPTARQELFLASIYKSSKHNVWFKDLEEKTDVKSFDLLIEMPNSMVISVECKLRIGRDNERTALQTVLSSFPPKIIPQMEKENQNYAVFIHPNITPRPDDLLKSTREILDAIKSEKTKIDICDGNYSIELKKLCEPGSGISKNSLNAINKKYSFSVKSGSPPTSSIIDVPHQYDIYDPKIIGISLNRLQKETPNYIKGALSQANKQLSIKEGAFGVVYYEDNHFNHDKFESNINQIHPYQNIDAVILYVKNEGISQHPLTNTLNPAIKFFHRIWTKNDSVINKNQDFFKLDKLIKEYSKSCKFKISDKDIKRLTSIYSKLGLF